MGTFRPLLVRRCAAFAALTMQDPALHADLDEDEQKFLINDDYEYVATLLNPKNDELVNVWTEKDDGDITTVISVAGSRYRVGRGYTECCGGADGDTPRTHTPGGVRYKGQGYGLMLYCGLALAATMRGKYGVYSPVGGRSSSAEKIWGSMVDSGLADRSEGDRDTDENWEHCEDVSDRSVSD